jgi:poly(3-hydroxybutyrate) depolymerase
MQAAPFHCLVVAALLLACGGAYRQTDDEPGGAGAASSPMAGRAGSRAMGGAPAGVGGAAQAGNGSGGLPPAGSPGHGGTSVGPGLVEASWPSTGCGRALPAEQVPTIPGSRTGYTEWFVTQTGETLGESQPTKAGQRQFFVRVPPDYDPSRPYRVVYVASGCGAQRAGKTNTYALFNEAEGGSEQAVYVALSVPDNDANPSCYDNNSGAESQEWEAFELIHSFVESSYCVDNNRIFVAGYSTGGWLANMWGCYFGGIPDPPRKFAPRWAIRGHAAVAASLPPNQPMPCSGPSAGIWIHDASDTSNRLQAATPALDLTLSTNGCSGNYADGPKQPWALAENFAGLSGGICQQYTGCAAEVAERYPLIFCTTNGLGHGDQSSTVIPALTAFFDLMSVQ